MTPGDVIAAEMARAGEADALLDAALAEQFAPASPEAMVLLPASMQADAAQRVDVRPIMWAVFGVAFVACVSVSTYLNGKQRRECVLACVSACAAPASGCTPTSCGEACR